MKTYRIKQMRLAQAAGGETLEQIAHDLRSPMCCVVGAAQTALLESHRGHAVDVQLTQILSAVEAMNRMLDNLCGSGHTSGRTLHQIQEAVLVVMGPRAAQKKQRLTVDLSALEEVRWKEDAALERVLLNLTGNAVKYTPEGGAIRVTACEEMGRAVLRVSDNGIGMTRDFQQRMYIPFERAQESAHLPGKGLGLSIVRRLVHGMGGTIGVRSALGQGTTFTVRIPIGPTMWQ